MAMSVYKAEGGSLLHGWSSGTSNSVLLMLSEDTNELTLAKINIYIGIFSRLVRVLVSLWSTEKIVSANY